MSTRVALMYDDLAVVALTPSHLVQHVHSQAKPSAVRRQLANALRALAMDAVQAAASGHPGMPMGMADIAEVLWNDFLRHNPADPQWVNRDRFVLSNGHGSMLLYALLHLSGYALPMEELQNFRQLHSKTPGHPEYGHTPGVETTTGPLGQGLANAVGMALGEKILARRFNRDDYAIVDHYTYVFVGDGCLMEGISHEVCSLAGVLGLGKLIVLYDDNDISIDGRVAGWFGDDTPARFRAYNWHVVEAVDGHDSEAVHHALVEARDSTAKPSLICCKTIIGYGAPNKAGHEASHGAPLGDAEVAAAREKLGWTHAPFVIPDDVYDGWDARTRGGDMQQQWQRLFADYRQAFPTEAAELEGRLSGDLPRDWKRVSTVAIAEATRTAESIATRHASQNTLEYCAPHLPALIGGSADLSGSNLTLWSGSAPLVDGGGRAGGGADTNYVFYGVREFGMCAMMNGLALHGGFIPYGATFLVFSDYARNAQRMAALMKLRVIFVFTHDSIGLGEDGPTHQAVEHAASLRLMPNLAVWRPCDAVEAAVAWQGAIARCAGPSALLLSRQNVPHQTRDESAIAAIARGAYVLRDCQGMPQLILLATGSEVGIAQQAAQQLEAAGHRVRVVSMPCAEVFDAQDESYRESVLPPVVKHRISIEAGVTAPWRKYVGRDGATLGLDDYGASAPYQELFTHFGLTAEHLVHMAEEMLTEH